MTTPKKDKGRKTTIKQGWELELTTRLMYLDLPKKYHQGLIEYVRSLIKREREEAYQKGKKEATDYYVERIRRISPSK